jgi:hypothetical protein
MLTIVNEKHKINQAADEADAKFIPPEKDPLNLKEKKTVVTPERAFDESFEFKDVTSTIWNKDI